jgi:hypothetical protein
VRGYMLSTPRVAGSNPAAIASDFNGITRKLATSPCGARFDSHHPAGSYVHRQHTAGGRWDTALMCDASLFLL